MSPTIWAYNFTNDALEHFDGRTNTDPEDERWRGRLLCIAGWASDRICRRIGHDFPDEVIGGHPDLCSRCGSTPIETAYAAENDGFETIFGTPEVLKCGHVHRIVRVSE